MSILTRLLLVGMFVTLGGTSAANAKQAPLPDHVLTLAICHGRYTAVLENGWLIGGEDTAVLLRRDYIAAMMEALILDEKEDRSVALALVSHRVKAKSQARRLLSAAQFSQDARRKRLALAQLRQHLGSCDLLMIEPRFHGL